MADETAPDQVMEQTAAVEADTPVEAPVDSATVETTAEETSTEETATEQNAEGNTESEAIKEEPEQKVEEEEEEEEEIAYVCPEEFDERVEMRKMFVGGLDKETTDEEFKELFSSYGEIQEAAIIRRNDSKSERLFGFITFMKCDTLEECLLQRPHKYKEKELDIKRAVPKGLEDHTGHYKVKKLHVANISEDFQEKDLKKYLLSRHPKKYGLITEINLLKTEEGKNRGFGFITVSTEDFADRISIGESKFTIGSNSMKMSKAKPRNSEGGGHRGSRGGGRMQHQYPRQGWEGWGDWNHGGWGYYNGYDHYNYGPHYGGYYRESPRGRYHPY